MSNTTVSPLGQINGAGDARALFLKKFSGDVLVEFHNRVFMREYVMSKTLTSGKSYQFPATGRATASRHVKGEDIFDSSNSYLNTIGHAERIVHLDRPLVAPVVVDDWEELVNHYETRGIYAGELGQALAEKLEQDLMRVGILASRASATVTGGGSQTEIVNTMATAGDIVDAFFDAKQQFEEQKVPSESRICVLPWDKYLTVVKGAPELVETTGGDAVPHPFRAETGDSGNGSVAEGYVRKIAGITLYPTNLLPQTDESATTDAGAFNTYYADFSTVEALFLQKSAIGLVTGRDVTVQGEDVLGTMSFNMVASYVMGAGILRPESAIQVVNVPS